VHNLLLGQRIERDGPALTLLAEAALAASMAERKAMEVEREVVDLYRAVFMKDKIGGRYEGTVTALVGSGLFVALDSPFVDVLVRYEDAGKDRFELDDAGLRAVAPRSGETIQLGDRLTIEIIDVAILRRTVYGRRIVGDLDQASKRRDVRNGRAVQVRSVGKTQKGREKKKGAPGEGRGGSREPDKKGTRDRVKRKKVGRKR
jgi:ribonuclease R